MIYLIPLTPFDKGGRNYEIISGDSNLKQKLKHGKGELFLRPILIIKSISSKVFIGVPLTSKSKNNGFYYDFSYVKNKKSYGILFQIRLFDTKRLKYKSGKINEDVFCKIKEKIREMFL